MPSAKTEFWAGVMAELPLMLGVVPFGLVFGVLGIASGLAPIETILMSSILFGGASQVVFAQLWGGGAPGLVVGGSVCIINIRHVLYSASMATHLCHLPIWWRILLAYLLTDEAYAVSIQRFNNGQSSPNQHFHLLGSGSLLWVGWQISTAVGVVVGETIPDNWSLSFAIPLTFIAIVAPILKTRADLCAAITAGSLAMIAQPLPWNLWLILAAIGGIIAGWSVNVYGQKTGKDWT
jgi:predicted branched-subunit amino acid permease